MIDSSIPGIGDKYLVKEQNELFFRCAGVDVKVSGYEVELGHLTSIETNEGPLILDIPYELWLCGMQEIEKTNAIEFNLQPDGVYKIYHYG